MAKRASNWSNLPKKYYYLVTNPAGKKDLILAETKFEAHAIMNNKDGYKYNLSEYKSKKTV